MKSNLTISPENEAAARQESRDGTALSQLPWHWTIFLAVAILLLGCRVFPSLYGDEYGSLEEAKHFTNSHGIAYSVQLHFWQELVPSDVGLRLLSLVWTAVGLWGLGRWLGEEGINEPARRFVLLFASLNPFLWFYGLQVRFYSVFFAATVLASWRFRAWQQQPSRRNGWLLLVTGLLLASSHLFGWLAIGAAVAAWGWQRLGKWRWPVVLGGVGCLLVVWIPAVHQHLAEFVQRYTNADTASKGYRGLTLASLVKVPLSFYYFTLGQRVYPLWWWITLPSVLLAGCALVVGWIRLARYKGLRVFAACIFLAGVFVFLVVDPLAPPGMQGAGPHYVIFTLPLFLVILGLGAGEQWYLAAGTALAECGGLACLFVGYWSATGSDLMDWHQTMGKLIPGGAETWIVTDGRAKAPVHRYARSGARLADELPRCDSAPKRIALISSDYRSEMNRAMDDLALSLAPKYKVTASMALFPAQITVYERDGWLGGSVVYPARLGLPEQDLELPLTVAPEGWKLDGFVRLDQQRLDVSLPVSLPGGPTWLASCYRAERPIPIGQPVAELAFQTKQGGKYDIQVRAGKETSAWDDESSSCRLLASWHKRFHLVGLRAYPGAHREHRAAVWGKLLPDMPQSVERTEVKSLLRGGTFYFWGLHKDSKATE